MDPNGTIVPITTDRGFTNHEHIDELGLIHMNGRIYDPTIGRFMSADPNIQSPSDIQSYNRYAYGLNNPLMYTDPSGYFNLLKSLGLDGPARAITNAFHSTIGRIAITVAVAYFTGYYDGGIFGANGVFAGTFATTNGIAIANGAAAGFAAGFVGSGGDFKSGVIGGITGAAFGYVGGEWEAGTLGNIAGHAAVGCASSSMSGGDCGSGALSAGFSAWASSKLPTAWAEEERLVAVTVIGGTSSVIGGGKFENGATTAAFGYLFNALGHSGKFGSVVIERDDGSIETRTGGSLSWRNYNPGNMRAGVSGYDAIGRNSGFAIFPDEETGFGAVVANLNTPRYQGLTVGQAIATWAPGSDGNDPVRYASQVSRWTGLNAETRMNALNSDQVNSVANSIKRYEGWRAGSVHIKPAPSN
ncbi:MAG: hypothetical protein EKK46_02675 [Rhodocyclaceae bacterium]|nr:MAG: hypothetical protein EKK46_02675 [Rhodocyclaceae bacterium]